MAITGLDEGKWNPDTSSENNPVDQAVTLDANTEFLVVAFHLFVGSHDLEELQVWLGESGDETAQPLTRQIEAFDAGQYVGIFTLNLPDMSKATNIRTQNVAVTAPYAQAHYRTYDADGGGLEVIDAQAIAHDTAVSVDLTFSGGANGDVIYDSIQAFNTTWDIDLTEVGSLVDKLGYRHRTGEELWDTAGAGPHGMDATVSFAAHGGVVLRSLAASGGGGGDPVPLPAFLRLAGRAKTRRGNMLLSPLTDGKVSGTGFVELKNNGIFGGAHMTSDGSTACAVVVRLGTSTGKIIYDTSSLSSNPALYPVNTEGHTTLYYSITGDNASAMLYEWVA